MKNKLTFYLLILLLFLSSTKLVLSNEFIFNTSQINILDNGNIIKATNGVATSNKDNINIVAEKFEYNKSLLILSAENGNATANNENIEIKANKFIYDVNASSINAIGNVVVKDLTKKTLIKSQSIFYYIDKRIIKSSTNSSIEDKLKNLFIVENFIYTLNDSLIKINKAKVIDNEKNIIKVD